MNNWTILSSFDLHISINFQTTRMPLEISGSLISSFSIRNITSKDFLEVSFQKIFSNSLKIKRNKLILKKQINNYAPHNLTLKLKFAISLF